MEGDDPAPQEDGPRLSSGQSFVQFPLGTCQARGQSFPWKISELTVAGESGGGAKVRFPGS